LIDDVVIDDRGIEDVVWAVVVAGGAGTRFGAPTPKQFVRLGGQRVLDHAVATARQVCPGRLVVVVPPDRVTDEFEAVVVAGGATRSASVRAGIAQVPTDATIVVVHDAARPLAPIGMFERVIDAVRHGADAAVPGVAIVDTVKQVRGGVVVGTLDRSELVAVQTPQAFRAAVLRSVHASDPEATDDAALVELGGGRVVVVDGDELARKVTTGDDLLWLQARVGIR
jgi:2-C-methyl-D-erythritol 4-phosphate cytidylyltransferase